MRLELNKRYLTRGGKIATVISIDPDPNIIHCCIVKFGDYDYSVDIHGYFNAYQASRYNSFSTDKNMLDLVDVYVDDSIKPKLMKFDPVTCDNHPYPSEASQYREYHGKVAWLYNPYTGQMRDARDIGSDVDGLLIGD